ncbi:hypothetical protein [Nocardia australiensis]|uniref:hypothetical protein n=1 Tax=Nocardia australiensis TaxID=2887191 RepID=UPI001D13460C|nr:hypothetical protein [Nocardia australiensis]
MDAIELEPPKVASPKHTGLVLDVATIGLGNPLALPGESTQPYIRCTNHTVLRLPDPLHDWATTVIATTHTHRAEGWPPIFPGQIEFGILDGAMYAELL